MKGSALCRSVSGRRDDRAARHVLDAVCLNVNEELQRHVARYVENTTVA